MKVEMISSWPRTHAKSTKPITASAPPARRPARPSDGRWVCKPPVKTAGAITERIQQGGATRLVAFLRLRKGAAPVLPQSLGKLRGWHGLPRAGEGFSGWHGLRLPMKRDVSKSLRERTVWIPHTHSTRCHARPFHVVSTPIGPMALRDHCGSNRRRCVSSGSSIGSGASVQFQAAVELQNHHLASGGNDSRELRGDSR